MSTRKSLKSRNSALPGRKINPRSATGTRIASSSRICLCVALARARVLGFPEFDRFEFWIFSIDCDIFHKPRIAERFWESREKITESLRPKAGGFFPCNGQSTFLGPQLIFQCRILSHKLCVAQMVSGETQGLHFILESRFPHKATLQNTLRLVELQLCVTIHNLRIAETTDRSRDPWFIFFGLTGRLVSARLKCR